MPFRRLLHTVIAVGFCLILLPGCNRQAGYQLSGTVKFDGKPIPMGKIYFSPDNSKKNVGATGYATITNGNFNTAAPDGKRHLGGPMIVKIEGFDPSAKEPTAPGDTSGEVTVKSLFPLYETSTDLPKSDAKQDFEVPLDAASRKISPETKADGTAP